MASQHDRFGPPEAYSQPPRTGRFWFDLLAATAAIFISVVSLAVAIRGERTQHGLLAANAWPFVQLSEDRSPEKALLDVENAGVGPAKILTFEVFYKGQPVDSTYDLLQRCCGLPAGVPDKRPAPIAGYAYGEIYNNVLRPGEHIVALRLDKESPSLELYSRFTLAMPDLTFKTCYCSVLGECWTSNLRDLAQIAVPQCPVSHHLFTGGSGL